VKAIVIVGILLKIPIIASSPVFVVTNQPISSKSIESIFIKKPMTRHTINAIVPATATYDRYLIFSVFFAYANGIKKTETIGTI
jgi:hypothetical protein